MSNANLQLQPASKRYELLADEIARQISSNVLRPGDRLPSIREACEGRQVSPSTVFQAYYLLESRGLIRAEPRSGYFVNSRLAVPPSLDRPPAVARNAVAAARAALQRPSIAAAQASVSSV